MGMREHVTFATAAGKVMAMGERKMRVVAGFCVSLSCEVGY